MPIFLFFDDYEVGNPLGSHSGIHKLGAVYVSIPCLPPHRQSSLNTIFLTLLFHSSDRQKFGNNIIFKPIIEELNFLRATGIDIDTDNFKGNIKFELGLITGDNLGIHSITGFVESFSSNYVCRICKVKKGEMRRQCYADESLTRNVEQYHLDVIEGDVSNSGIKEICVWHDVLGFNVLDNVGVDIMHDLLEGVCKYDLSFLLLYYVQDLKFFSLQVLNERIICFDYGPDKGSKPSILFIEHLKKNTLKLSASEMMSFTRYLGLIIGDFIPRNEPVWELYILLRLILDLVTSPVLQKECSELLQTLVAEHHDLYLKFSKYDLKPKYHYMVHYHEMMKKFGPLLSVWSMRFEAKHRISKISANTSSNRRNICKTLAIKHQLQLNDMFLKGTLSNEVKLGPCNTVINNIDTLALKQFIQKDSPDSIIINCYNCPWISVKGTRYKSTMILTLDIFELNGLEFGMINKLFFCNNNLIIFQCFKLNTVIFDEHYHSFEVEKEIDDNIFIYYNNLASFIPNHISTMPNGKTYVTLRS